jgi:hypothetical protein
MTTGVGGRGGPYQGSRGLPRDTSREIVSRRPSASRSQTAIRGAPNLRANARPVGLKLRYFSPVPSPGAFPKNADFTGTDLQAEGPGLVGSVELPT